MAKKVKSVIKLQISAGMATPAPPVGPALGQNGVNIQEFCKQFNDRTKGEKKGIPIPVTISVYEDRSYSFIAKLPPTSFLIKDMIGIKKGSSAPGRDITASITKEQIKEIASKKQNDLNSFTLDAAVSMVAGTARSMGIRVEE